MSMASSNSRGSIPAGFQEVFRWNISQLKSRMVFLQVIAGVVLILSAAAYFFLAVLFGRIEPGSSLETLLGILEAPYRIGLEIGKQLSEISSGAASRMVFQALGGVLLALGGVIGVQLLIAFLHEGVHGAAMRIFGARPSFGFLWKGLMFYATSPGYAYSRAQYIWVIVAPLLVLDVLFLLALFLPVGLTGSMILAVLFAFNTAGAFGDLWILSIVLRFPSDAFVVDEKDGMRIFLLTADSGRA